MQAVTLKEYSRYVEPFRLHIITGRDRRTNICRQQFALYIASCGKKMCLSRAPLIRLRGFLLLSVMVCTLHWSLTLWHPLLSWVHL